ncbi:uncharacterized protein J8A68_000947 [[Candida] subhashii]|uniref:Beta-lactamase-related domain-containing protein n=1 Tax=[Candida] subhashii TaxID=561895 RepID=A0A8J5R5K6_9ASCO|nr:uncharacterized protein J8A68_000947 [[Candida] subhashii]KAG7665545.1 hypothetical protein J8A68_000947 [[Candida] subhashii]
MSITRKQLPELKSNIDSLINKLTTYNENGKPPLVAPAICIGVSDDKQTLYLNSKGVRSLEDPESTIDNDSIFSLFSCTKTMTAMAILILYEQGKLSLDLPCYKYLPEIELIGIVDPGTVNKQGQYTKLPRKPKVPITIRHLLLHLSGFSYGFINAEYHKLITKGEKMDPINPPREFFSNKKTPLVHEPGSDFMYGHSYEWLGFIVQAISGKPLGEFLKEYVFDPIGMTSCTFHLLDESKLVRVHYRNTDDSIKLMKRFPIHPNPILDLGGQGCLGTVGDYLKLLRVWLNYGYSPDSGKRILNESTVKWAIENHMPGHVNVEFQGMSHNEDESYVKDGWSLTGNAINMNDLKSGRPKGCLYWSGLGNLYYWLDFHNKVCGLYAGQLLPFLDEYAFTGYQEFESYVYQAINKSKREQEQQNPTGKL